MRSEGFSFSLDGSTEHGVSSMRVATPGDLLAARIRAMPFEADPWPYGVLDDFLPAELYAGLLATLAPVGPPKNFKKRDLPADLCDFLRSPIVLDAIRERWGFTGGRPTIEALYCAKQGIPRHVDRPDKLWSGQVYLTGDPKGTELFNADGDWVRSVEWKPNRLAAWTRPPLSEKHAAPKSSGRWVLLYWIMQG